MAMDEIWVGVGVIAVALVVLFVATRNAGKTSGIGGSDGGGGAYDSDGGDGGGGDGGGGD